LNHICPTLPASDDANAYIFPNAAAHKRTASLSNQFRKILVEAGLVEPLPRGHRSTGKGRTGRREMSELSFHSLRDSAVTMPKAAGVSDFIAREIVGHESAAVSRQYTHLTTADKRAAMQRLRDITNTQNGFAIWRRVEMEVRVFGFSRSSALRSLRVQGRQLGADCSR
jgi:integrase